MTQKHVTSLVRSIKLYQVFNSVNLPAHKANNAITIIMVVVFWLSGKVQ